MYESRKQEKLHFIPHKLIIRFCQRSLPGNFEKRRILNRETKRESNRSICSYFMHYHNDFMQSQCMSKLWQFEVPMLAPREALRQAEFHVQAYNVPDKACIHQRWSSCIVKDNFVYMFIAPNCVLVYWNYLVETFPLSLMNLGNSWYKLRIMRIAEFQAKFHF